MQGLDICLKEIVKSYGDKSVLKGCSHVFEKGELHALIGPNGSGKTTLLRICGLLDAPDTGEVFYSNSREKIPLDLSLRRRITMVFSKGGLFNMTVFKNAAYGLKIRGRESRHSNKLVEEALQKVGLWDKRAQNARTLSAGEAQRLAIARTLVFEPEVILLDEPTASLDPANTTLIEELIMKLVKTGNRTVIMATHNMFQAQRLSDKVIFMHEGSIIEAGPCREFFAGPKNEISRQFLAGKLIC